MTKRCNNCIYLVNNKFCNIHYEEMADINDMSCDQWHRKIFTDNQLENLKSLSDKMFEYSCMKYYSNCHDCPFGELTDIDDFGFDCIISKFVERLERVDV